MSSAGPKAQIDLAPVFPALFENQVGREAPLEDAVGEADGERVTRLVRTFEFENFVSIASDAQQVIKRKQEEITDDFYDDYTRYAFGIVGEDERSSRSLVGDGVVAPEAATAEDTRLFAVELLNRLLFIKLLEDKEVVQPDLLRTLRETYEGGCLRRVVLRGVLQAALLRRDERETRRALVEYQKYRSVRARPLSQRRALSADDRPFWNTTTS